MIPSPFPKNSLSDFDKPALVVYVEDAYNAELNEFIQSYYTQIKDAFATKEIDFCYLPHLLLNKNYPEITSGESSELKSKITSESIPDSYSKLKQLLVQPFLGPGLLWLDNYKDSAISAFGCQLMDDKPLMDQFELFASVIAGLSEFGLQKKNL